ncbi:hypothetical protein BKA62DRAFT_697208 [Auriculariales sp. MPI-PUGE-AT-0066]|nr:hypothetical protein BKA62DRAFT_697208 [Auriculariales sp. MPI-PUGE-AT-0066]
MAHESASRQLAPLRKLVDQYPPHRLNAKQQGETYDAIWLFCRDVLQHSVPSATPAPPWALAYHINAVTTPEVSWDFIPDLLRSLGQLEVWRCQCIDEAQLILAAEDVKASPRYFNGVPRQLLPAQHKKLERFVRRTTQARAKFRILVLQTCYLHILHERAWPARTRNVPRLIRLYFPKPNQLQAKLVAEPDHAATSKTVNQEDATQPMHIGELEIFQTAGGLSNMELEDYVQMRDKVVELVKNAAEWDDERRTFWQQHNPAIDPNQNSRFVSYSRDFEAEFFPPIPWSKVQSTLHGYVDDVSELYDLCYPADQTSR